MNSSSSSSAFRNTWDCAQSLIQQLGNSGANLERMSANEREQLDLLTEILQEATAVAQNILNGGGCKTETAELLEAVEMNVSSHSSYSLVNDAPEDLQNEETESTGAAVTESLDLIEFSRSDEGDTNHPQVTRRQSLPDSPPTLLDQDIEALEGAVGGVAAESGGLDWEIAPPDSYEATSFKDLVETEDECVLCQISSVQSQYRFWVVPYKLQRQYRRMQTDLADAVRVMEAEDFRLSPRKLRKNLPVVARYSLDGNWYRARVEQAGDADCHVQFVDFGNTSFVPVAEIFPLPHSFLDLRTAAIECRMTGVDTRELDVKTREKFVQDFPEDRRVLCQPLVEMENHKEPGRFIWKVDLLDQNSCRPISTAYKTRNGSPCCELD